MIPPLEITPTPFPFTGRGSLDSPGHSLAYSTHYEDLTPPTAEGSNPPLHET